MQSAQRRKDTTRQKGKVRVRVCLCVWKHKDDLFELPIRSGREHHSPTTKKIDDDPVGDNQVRHTYTHEQREEEIMGVPARWGNRTATAVEPPMLRSFARFPLPSPAVMRCVLG